MVLKKIANILRDKGSVSCLEKAKSLELESSKLISLNLRNLGLGAKDIFAIADCIKQGHGSKGVHIHSVSFSYNHLMGNLGSIALARVLPSSIREIGFVDCGIGDDGAYEILNWMNTSEHLQMICLEQNNFSEQLKMDFKAFKKSKPQVMVVV
jgi:hypothetical protein